MEALPSSPHGETDIASELSDLKTNETLDAQTDKNEKRAEVARDRLKDEIATMLDLISRSDRTDDGYLNLAHLLRHKVDELAGKYETDSEEQKLAIGLRDRVAKQTAGIRTTRERATDQARLVLTDGVRTRTPIDTFDFDDTQQKAQFTGMLEATQAAMHSGDLKVEEQRMNLIKMFKQMQDFFPSMPLDFREFVDSALEMLREEDKLTNGRSRDRHRNFADSKMRAGGIVQSGRADTRELVHFGRDISESKLDVEKSQELVQNVREALREFETKIDSLGLGPRTTAQAKELLSQMLTQKDGIQLFEKGPSRMIDYGMVDKKVRTGLHIEIDHDNYKTYSDWLDAPLFEQGIELSLDQIRQLGIDWVVWHECGHLLEEAYSMQMPKVTKYGSEWDAELPDAATESGVSLPYKEGLDDYMNFRVQSERFAEGLARKLIYEKLTTDYGLTADQVKAVDEGFLKARRTKRYHAAVQLVEEEHTMQALVARMEEADTSFAYIGYGNPAGEDELAKILALAP